MAASVKGTMAPLARKYEVSFSTKVASDVPLVNGDYEKTTRMLENLASNAIKFTPTAAPSSCAWRTTPRRAW